MPNAVGARHVGASRAKLDTREARRSGPHKVGDRKGKAQSTKHAVGARKGRTSFRVTVDPGCGVEFVEVGTQCPSNLIWYGVI